MSGASVRYPTDCHASKCLANGWCDRESVAAARLLNVQHVVRRQADRTGWRFDQGGPHPVFAALADEALAILAERGVCVSAHQARTIRWIADGEIDTLIDVVNMILDASWSVLAQIDSPGARS